jgi:hypothetical protein
MSKFQSGKYFFILNLQYIYINCYFKNLKKIKIINYKLKYINNNFSKYYELFILASTF